MRDQENITPIDQFVIDFVRNLRITKELTQADIGNIIGISRSYISDVERTNSRAKYNISHVNALADYFNMSPRDFFPEKAMPLFFPGREKIGIKTKKAKSSVGQRKKIKSKK